MIVKSNIIGCIAIACIVFATPAHAQSQLITNGGFETGDYSGWTLTGDNSPGDGTQVGFHNGVGYSGESIDGETPINANSGSYYFYFGNDSGDATLSQTINTTAGQKYDFSFYVNVLPGATPNDFSANFGNNAVYTVQNLQTQGWQNLNFQVQATGSATTVSFASYNYPTNDFLDDVSVKAVPEASTTALFGVLIAGSLFMIRVRSRRNTGMVRISVTEINSVR